MSAPRTVDFAAAYARYPGLDRQPIATRILLENLIRHDDGSAAHRDRIAALAAGESVEIDFRPTRVLMQDYAGMPALIDLAGLRSTAAQRGHDPLAINPAVPVDLVVDHSVMADVTRMPDALRRNLANEYAQNAERYRFLKWAAQAFEGLRVVPPGQGIVHQINTEVLASVVAEVTQDGALWHVPDTLVGTDSHTTMVNGLGVLGWGVGGIEAEAVMLGEPVSMLAPPVVGVELTGAVPVGCLATDAVLALTEFLRAEGVVGSIVEFHGPGCAALSAADRLTIANMAPEFGSTAAFFPTDDKTLEYLRSTGRSVTLVERVRTYLTGAGLWFDPGFVPEAARHLRFDLGAVTRVVAGPKRPEERRALSELPGLMRPEAADAAEIGGLRHGDIVIASITSCTNTANPEAMITAGLLARAARRRGLRVEDRIKTSLAPGSRAVTAYLGQLDLLEDLSALGFDIVAYGCTTCVGNSGALSDAVAETLEASDLTVASVLSGNRNFEARIHPKVKANFLASPPLVIAYALAGTMAIDLEVAPLGRDADGQPVFLADLWPSPDAVRGALIAARAVDAPQRDAMFQGGPEWQALEAPDTPLFDWDPESTYLRPPPFFEMAPPSATGDVLISGARPLLALPDSVTTDHISPVGRIAPDSAAAQYLLTRGVGPDRFNAYGARRGDHDVMTRGTFANVRLDNRLSDRRGGWTRRFPERDVLTVFDAAEAYRARGEPMVVLAGLNYGAGSARDWAAKGTRLLGVDVVIAQSFERIHRANLVRLGVMPVIVDHDGTLFDVDLGDDPFVSVRLGPDGLAPRAAVEVRTTSRQGDLNLSGYLGAETADELSYWRAGGILPYVAAALLGSHAPMDARSGKAEHRRA